MNSIRSALSFDQPRDEELGEARPMTRSDFSTVFEEIKNYALSELAGSGSLAPTVFLPSLQGASIFKMGVMDVSMLVNDPAGKDVLSGLLSQLVSHPDHDFCVFAHEAWVLKADALPGETAAQARARVSTLMGAKSSLADAPGREEAMVMILRSKNAQAMAMLPIRRDTSGAISEIEPGDGLIFPDESASFEGRFAPPTAEAPEQNAPSTRTLQ